MPITRINHFEAKKETTRQLDAFMQDVVMKVKALPGCRSVRLLHSIENNTHFAVVEEWDSIEAHQKAATAVPPDQLKHAQELVAAPPVGEYFQQLLALRPPRSPV